MSTYRRAYPYRYRPLRRYRSPYGRRGSGLAPVVGVAIAAVAISGAAAKTAAPSHAAASQAHVTAVISGGSEDAFMTAVLADLGAPVTAANIGSLEAWVRHETPWPPVAADNPMNTTLAAPGSWAFNTFDGDLHVQAYPSASEGAQATALTLAGGYPLITAALRSGAGLCGNWSLAGEFGKWSGDGYQEVC